MARVRGIDGIFFKSENPAAPRAWYGKHLGFVGDGDGSPIFPWTQPDSPSRDSPTRGSVFSSNTPYFGENKSRFMLNCFVDDPHATLEALCEEGVWNDPKVEEYD
jgi:hypothetical protein